MPAVELGHESWGIRQDSPGGAGNTSMTFGWRRSNLVPEAHVVCLQCPSDLEEALRTWARTVDREAEPKPDRSGPRRTDRSGGRAGRG